MSVKNKFQLPRMMTTTKEKLVNYHKNAFPKKRKKNTYKSKTKAAISRVAVEYSKAKEAAQKAAGNVAPGTLKKLIQSAVSEFELPEGCIKPSSIISRVKGSNPTGVAHQKVSPLEKIELLMVEWCLQMAMIGMALTNET
jgi:hypothetical protein